MGEPTMLDDTAKQRVKDALKSQADAHLTAADATLSQERAAAGIDPATSYSADDLSQSDEEGELHGLLGAARDQQRADLASIEALDFGPSDVVRPGAIIAFDGDSYVVGVVAEAFDSDGVTYEGISADSPLYPAIVGLGIGDEFTFNGKVHRLDIVC